MWSLVMYSNYFDWNHVRLHQLIRSYSSVMPFMFMLSTVAINILKIMHGIIFVFRYWNISLFLNVNECLGDL